MAKKKGREGKRRAATPPPSPGAKDFLYDYDQHPWANVHARPLRSVVSTSNIPRSVPVPAHVHRRVHFEDNDVFNPVRPVSPLLPPRPSPPSGPPPNRPLPADPPARPRPRPANLLPALPPPAHMMPTPPELAHLPHGHPTNGHANVSKPAHPAHKHNLSELLDLDTLRKSPWLHPPP